QGSHGVLHQARADAQPSVGLPDAGVAARSGSTTMRSGAVRSLRRQTSRAATKVPPHAQGLAVHGPGCVTERAGARARGTEVPLQAEPAELQGRDVVRSHRIVLLSVEVVARSSRNEKGPEGSRLPGLWFTTLCERSGRPRDATAAEGGPPGL